MADREIDVNLVDPLDLEEVCKLLKEKTANKYLKYYTDYVAFAGLQVGVIPTQRSLLEFLRYKRFDNGRRSGWDEDHPACKGSTLWSVYSSLNFIIQHKYGIELKVYRSLSAFIRLCQSTEKPKKARIMEFSHLKLFWSRVDLENREELVRACQIITGVIGGHRAQESTNLNFSNLVRVSNGFHVSYHPVKNRGCLKTFNYFVPIMKKDCYPNYGLVFEKYLDLVCEDLETTFDDLRDREVPLWLKIDRHSNLFIESAMSYWQVGQAGYRFQQIAGIEDDTDQVFS